MSQKSLALIDGDVILHAAMWETGTLEGFKSRVDNFISEWTDNSFSEDYVMALGPRDGRNYRDDIYVDYKKSKSRENSRKKRKEYIDEAKEYMYSRPGAVEADYVEADDLLGHWSTQHDNACIVSIDKDLNQIPGRHYNPHYMKPLLYTVDERSAKIFFQMQMLTGDSVDNIPGLPGVGPVRAKRLYEENRGDVVEIYKSTVGDHWRDLFLANGKMLFIQRRPNHIFTLDLYEEELI